MGLIQNARPPEVEEEVDAEDTPPAAEEVAPVAADEGAPDEAEGAAPEGEADPELAATTGDDTPALRTIEERIFASVQPGHREAVLRLLAAGMKVMTAPALQSKIRSRIDGVPPEQIPQEVAVLIGALLSILQKETRGPFPMDAVVPAGVLLAGQALDILIKAGRMPADEVAIGEAMQAVLSVIVEKIAKGQEGGAAAPQPEQAPDAAGRPGDLRPGPGQGPAGAAPTPQPQGLVSGAMMQGA